MGNMVQAASADQDTASVPRKFSFTSRRRWSSRKKGSLCSGTVKFNEVPSDSPVADHKVNNNNNNNNDNTTNGADTTAPNDIYCDLPTPDIPPINDEQRKIVQHTWLEAKADIEKIGVISFLEWALGKVG